MNYRLSDCREVKPERLCAAMNAAFSDYVIPLKLSVAQFETFQRQRGFDARRSFLLWDGEEIAAFWFSGASLPRQQNRAYTLSVGTVPGHRRKGLSRRLLEAVVSEQRRSDRTEGLQLEVITSNTPAIASYEAMGFVKARTLRVLKLESQPSANASSAAVETLSVADLPAEAGGFFEAAPTPQNARQALEALSPDVFVAGIRAKGDLVGWGAVYPDGAVAQLAVHEDRRRQGLGSAILNALWTAAGQEALSFVNVDAGAAATNAFLEAHGAQELLQQYEMRLAIT